MSDKLIGTKPNQVPTNADLGEMAYQNKDDVTLAAASKSSLTIKRKDDDGDLVKLKRDETTAGQLGIYGSGTGAYLNATSVLSLRIAGGDILTINNGNIYPTSDSGVNLGLSNRHFNNLHMSGTAHIDGGIQSASYSHLDDLPDVRPSLLLDFANSKTLDPRITFTRGSTATYWDGKTTTKAEENLISNSRYTGGSGWNSGNYTEYQDHATAPDGTTTATKVSPNSSAAGISVAIGTGIGNGGDTITWSMYAKQDSTDYPAISMYFNSASAARASFDLTNGTVIGTNGGTGTVTASIVDAGNGWYRCIATFSGATTSECTFYVIDAADNNDFTLNNSPDGIKGMLVWGPQVEKRSSATAYTPTTSSPIVKYQPTLQTAASGEARFDHDPVTGESKGLLIEESRTNIIRESENINAWNVYFNGNKRSNQVVAPDGTLTGDEVENWTGSSGSGLGVLRIPTASSVFTGTIYSISVWLKSDTSGATVDVQLGDNTLLNDIALTDEWVRYTAVGSPASDNYNFIDIEFPTGMRFFVWGAQVELGSFATSYIPTSGSTVTRAVDDASITDMSWYNYSNTMDLEFTQAGKGVGPYTMIVQAVQDGNNRWGFLQQTSTDEMRLISYGTGNLTFPVISSVTYGTEMELAMTSPDLTQVVTSVDGASAVTTNTTAFPQPTSLYIGKEISDNKPFSGHFKKIAFYPKRLSDATLQAMTEE